MGVQRCWNAWNSRLVIQTRSYDCIIINSFSVFLHFSFLPLHTHTHTHTHTTHTQHTHITVPHSNAHFFRWKIENRPTDEHHLQSVCIFCPNLQQRATKKKHIREKRTFFIHHAFYPISEHIIHDKLFYSSPEKVRSHKWCGRDWMRPVWSWRGMEKRWRRHCELYLISNLQCCTRECRAPFLYMILYISARDSTR